MFDRSKLKKTAFLIVRKIGRFFYRKHVWLVSDRQFFAGDNGEAFFKFLQEKPVNSVFALSKESEDYDRISRIGKTVDYGSPMYKFLLCVCDAHISSQLLHMENHEETYQIFLQHGVAEKDISSFLNPVCHDNFYVITTGEAEKKSFEEKPYIIDPEKVWLTGLPRYDYLYDKPSKKITLSLT